MKNQGTSKMGNHCKASLKAVEFCESGKVAVEFCLWHVGHDSELGHLRILDDIRSTIAGKLAKGVKVEAILDEIRFDTKAVDNRGHLVARQDIHNIKHQFNIELMKRHKKDTVRVHCWVEELRKCDFNLILVYKPQGRIEFGLPADNFLLGIQTKYQLDQMKKNGSNIICMDATQSTNQYDFQIITVLVIDHFGEGLPVAWLISNREDKLVLNPFIAAIREAIGDVKVRLFVADDANNFYNAWPSYFPVPDSKLICSWHVDKNWQKNLQKHVQTHGEQGKIYKALKLIQMELQETVFWKLVQEFSGWCEEKYRSFNAYFMETYMHSPEQWASCFGFGAGVNT